MFLSSDEEQSMRIKFYTSLEQLTYKANSVIEHKSVPPMKYRILDPRGCLTLDEWCINLDPLIMSFARLAIINMEKINQPAPAKSAVSLHTFESRGHFQVNCMSILSSCKLASEAMTKKTRIPTCMPSVANATIQPRTLSVTK